MTGGGKFTSAKIGWTSNFLIPVFSHHLAFRSRLAERQRLEKRGKKRLSHRGRRGKDQNSSEMKFRISCKLKTGPSLQT